MSFKKFNKVEKVDVQPVKADDITEAEKKLAKLAKLT